MAQSDTTLQRSNTPESAPPKFLILLLAGAAVALLLPSWAGAAFLVGIAAVWLLRWAARVEKGAVGALLLAAAALLAYDHLDRSASLDPERKREAIQQQFAVLWNELDLTEASAVLRSATETLKAA